MKRQDIFSLYHEMSFEYGIPEPVCIFFQGNLKFTFGYVGTSLFMRFNSEISGVEDQFGIIFLPHTISIFSAIHEFFHYYDYFCNLPENENYVNERTIYYISKKNIKNADKLIFKPVTKFNVIINKIFNFLTNR